MLSADTKKSCAKMCGCDEKNNDFVVSTLEQKQKNKLIHMFSKISISGSHEFLHNIAKKCKDVAAHKNVPTISLFCLHD